MTIIPLTSAYLCQNCDHVGEKSTQCERCKSRAVFPLSVWVPSMRARFESDDTLNPRLYLFAGFEEGTK
jgi:hypothetical protein